MAPTADAAPLAPRQFGRFVWAQLTAMRTAIALLFALAIAAIPGSLGPNVLPQRPNNPVLVREWIANHPQLGPLFDRVGLFDVYTSAWFSAIYLLLLVSMVGCLVPRIAVYARAVRAMPSGVPRRIDRLEAHASGTSTLTADEALDAGEKWLLARRYRVRRSGRELSGEIGYLRELGNLAFHISILGVLAGVAVSTLFGFKGSVIVTEGSAFSNNLSQYDDFTAGGAFGGALTPFTLWVDKFDVSFERGSVQHGAAREFLVHARLADASGAPQETTVEVNHPVIEGGTMVNLIGHGYASVVTVTDAAGRVAFSGPVVFLPQDGNFTSLGVIKAPDARPQRLAFDSVFVPSQSAQAGVGPRSTFPDLDNPMLWGTVYTGAPKVETGTPENVYSLDKTGLTQVMDGAAPASFRLAPGASYTLPDGSTLRFDSVKRWVKLQVSSTPGLPITYGSIALAVAGLILSLFVKPRRVFARLSDADGAGLGVETGGLDRAASRTGLAETVAGLAAALGATDAVGVLEHEDSPAAAASSTVAGSDNEETA
jgi:cytochrome c biogenesis protein